MTTQQRDSWNTNTRFSTQDLPTPTGGAAVVVRMSKGKRSVGDVGKKEKKKARKSITRTTLINPQGISWPDPPATDEAEILETIGRCIEVLKVPKTKVPRSVIKNVAKKDRGVARKQWQTNNAVQLGYDVAKYMSYRTSLCLGVNCVSRALENEALAAVVIEKNVNPDVITKMLVPLAVNKGVPILSVTGLTKVFDGVWDIRCLAFGLKKECEDVSNRFFPICKIVKEVHEKHFLVTEEVVDAKANSESLVSATTGTTTDDPTETDTNSQVKQDAVTTETLKSTEKTEQCTSETATDGEKVVDVTAESTEEPPAKRSRRASLTIDEELADIKEAGMTSLQNSQNLVRKRKGDSGESTKPKIAKKPFIPAKVRKVKLN